MFVLSVIDNFQILHLISAVNSFSRINLQTGPLTRKPLISIGKVVFAKNNGYGVRLS